VVTDKERRRVMACTNLAQLDRWIKRAVTITSIEQLFADE